MILATWEQAYTDVHAERLAFLASVGETRRADGVLAVVTGAWSNTDNGVVCTRDDVADDLVAELVAWVRSRRVPASWLCAGFDASDELRERLARAGLQEETTGVTSGAALSELELPPPSPAGGVLIEEAVGSDDLEAWLGVAVSCKLFDADDRELRRRRRLLHATGGVHELSLRHWVARRDGRPIGLATAFFAGTTVLLEHVAVVEEQRHRGVGTALALVRLHEARRLGCSLAVFGTTPASGALYEPLGFTTTPVAGRRWFYFPVEP